MIKCISFYLKITGFFISIIGLCLLLATNEAIYAKHIMFIGAIITCFAYILKLFVPKQMIFDWWLTFPELHSDGLLLKRESVYNRLMFFYYLFISLSLLGVAGYFFCGYYQGLWISGIFACISLILYLIKLGFFSFQNIINPNWSLVYPELAGLYNGTFSDNTGASYKKISEEEVYALKAVYQELCDLNIAIKHLKEINNIK